MAERRMFSKKIVHAARFLQLSPQARLLYYDLGMAADDDGVVEAYTVLQLDGMSRAQLDELAAHGLIRILRDDLVSWICDWRMNNQIRKDRYAGSIYRHLLPVCGNPEEERKGEDRTEEERTGQDAGQNAPPCGNPEEERKGKDRTDENRTDEDRIDQVRSVEERKAEQADRPSAIEQCFSELFGRSPDRSFVTTLRRMMRQGYAQDTLLRAMRAAAPRAPRNPEAYLLGTIRQFRDETPPVCAAPPPAAAAAPAQDAPLAGWERDWLAQIARRREADLAAPRAPQEGGDAHAPSGDPGAVSL